MCPTKNNIQCLASKVCLNMNSLPFCAAHICTLHLAVLLSICVLTTPRLLNLPPALCLMCFTCVSCVAIPYIYILYIYMYVCIVVCLCVFVSLLLYWVNFCARHLPCVWNMLIHTGLCVILRLGTWWYLHIPSLVNYTIVKVLNAQKIS